MNVTFIRRLKGHKLLRRLAALIRFIAQIVGGLDQEEICIRPAEKHRTGRR